MMIEVGAAIVTDANGRILIARRRPGKAQAGFWEFPGGKLEPGESAEACIRRELREEMSIDVEVDGFFAENVHDYGSVTIRLIAYRARFRGGELRLTDHDKYCWVTVRELMEYAFAPADVPLVQRLARVRN